jgi:transcriptional regulator with XRE-family HTH domain
MTTSSPDLTPKVVRAARALLAWSQQDLAKAAGVATSTVADFERGQRTPVANNAQAMRTALENAGIHFLPNGAVNGPPVPPIVGETRPGAPIRWVDAEDLAKWADRTDGAVSLPTLISHLIRATLGSSIRLRFPSDEGVRHPGWDGHTVADHGNAYVPQGEAGWEIGSQRSNIAQKASEDYIKRTSAPSHIDPALATFIFVTPRHWPKKDEWAKAREAEGAWREVRVYDANDLVHWIEQAPAVGLWLATRLEKRPAGTRELEDVWNEWSLATQWPLTEELVLSDRDEDAAETLRWLRDEPSLLSLQATTADEVIAFFRATLGMLPDEVAAGYRSRCLVASTAASARALANAPAPLIILLAEPDAGLANMLVERGHYVLQAYDERPVARGELRILARPSREGIASALIAAGIARPRAEALARDSARNLAILRRLIPAAPGRLPDWAKPTPPRELLAALLLGGWDEDAEADRARLAEMADQPYDKVIAALTPFVGDFDKPLQKIGSAWRITSPADAWVLLAPYLTSVDISRFEAAAFAVLGSSDPRFEMNPDERWMASIRGVRREYSGLLRHGIGQVLILLALWGDSVRTVQDAARRADAIVGKLLLGADQHRWWSLSGDFRLLSEASPAAFLSAIEDSLDQEDPPIRVLFGTEEGGPFGTEHISELLWAIETLAWSPDLLPRASLVLARLDAIDNPPGRYANRPANSLREIHLLWNPQTFATLEQRLKALDLIRKHESDAAWKLMLGILPRGHDAASPTSMPRWRDFSVDKVETVTWNLMSRGAAAVSKRLSEDVGTDANRWSLLIERLMDLAPDGEAALAQLAIAEQQMPDDSDRAKLRDSLRRLLHHHRQFPDAEWSLPKEVLGRLDAMYERFAPTDPLQKVAWLFAQSVALPDPPSEGWETEQRDVDIARKRAAATLFAESGITGVLALARLVEAPGYLGKALYDAGLSEGDLDQLLEASARSEDARERDVAHGLIISVIHDRKQPWGENLIARAVHKKWGPTAISTILRAFPIERWTWDLASTLGKEIEETYWRRTPVFWINENSDDNAFAIRSLIAVGRARHALALAGRGKKVHLPSALLVELLEAAARQPFEDDGDHNAPVMFQHNVAEVLKLLDERADVEPATLIALEWNYLTLLEHSRRPAKVLLRALSEHPPLFIQMLRAVFKPKEDSGVVEPEPEDPAHAKTVASQAYRLLRLWDRLPGTRDDGTIDGAVLENWIKEARSLARDVGRERIADDQIGNMLSASPIGTDGNWPAEPVRDVLDLFRSAPMLQGFSVGKGNRRGVTTRMPRDGGALDRAEAAQYRTWANAIAFDHPHTAKALESLAESYDHQAKRYDEDAERIDWE